MYICDGELDERTFSCSADGSLLASLLELLSSEMKALQLTELEA